MNTCDDSVAAGELAASLCQTMADIHRRGWCDGTGGNFSCVSSRKPLRLLMAPSGVDKGQVQPGELIEVDAQAAVVAGGGKASAETLLHLKIVEVTGAGAVLHTHSQAATLLSRDSDGHKSSRRPETTAEETDAPAAPARHVQLEGLEMLKGLEGITSHRQQIAIPVLANDQNLQRLSERAHPHLAEAPYGLLISGHGLYAWGRDLGSARRHLEILEFLLEQHWRHLLLTATTAIGALS
ncbi:MAG: methylthioribulose 1-phosphate dehydratase [Cyanobacteria bacterium]|nr:methylthioribulose 1-phosphate dehydratase [Cyanobacteriota bacterium]